MFYIPYTHVIVSDSKSSYGKYVVKTSEVTFRFFWRKKQADQYAKDWNNGIEDKTMKVSQP